MSKKTVIGVFKSHGQAEKAVKELTQKGFKESEINLLTAGGKEAGRGGGQGGRQGYGQTTMGTMGTYGGGRGGDNVNMTNAAGEDISEGVTTGGTIGGLAGLLAGAGALAVPGFGPLLAAGPIAGALTGAVTGGVAGGLIDYGLPEDRGRYYEQEAKQGNIVAFLKCDESKVNDVAQIFRSNGATDVETH